MCWTHDSWRPASAAHSKAAASRTVQILKRRTAAVEQLAFEAGHRHAKWAICRPAIACGYTYRLALVTQGRRRGTVISICAVLLLGGVFVVLSRDRGGSATTDTKGDDIDRIPDWAHVEPGQIAAARAAGWPVAFENLIGMRFVLIPPGKFLMGSVGDEAGNKMRGQDEDPHEVELTRPYYVAVYETRNREYRLYGGAQSTYKDFDGPDQPAVGVSFEDALGFAKWLGGKDAAHRYALPTEAQWEYAARAGTVGNFPFLKDWKHFRSISRYANVYAPPAYTGDPEDFVRGRTTDVGTFRANPWGLFDTVGNVGEWCSDWYHERYDVRVRTDPAGPAVGEDRANRGGSWGSSPWNAQSASRNHHPPSERNDSVGFRLIAHPLPR